MTPDPDKKHIKINYEYDVKNNIIINNNNSKLIDSDGNVFIQISDGMSYDYLGNYKLVLLIFTCSLGFLSTGTFIGWTSNFFKIPIYNEMFTCSQISYISSMLPVGAIVGVFLIGITKIPKYVGIKIILLISSFGLALSLGIFYVDLEYSFTNLLVSRFCSGLSIGVLHVFLPIYITEFAPNELKPIFEYILYINFAIGILLQYISGFYISVFISTTISFVTTMVFAFGCIALPESPQHLWSRKKYGDAQAILEKYCGSTKIIENRNKFNFEKLYQYDGSVLDEIFDRRNFSTIFPFLVFTVLIQFMGGYSIFFYLWKTFIHLESDFSSETISVSSTTIFVVALPLYLALCPDFQDRLMLKITTSAMTIACLFLGFYTHQGGVTGVPTNHGYIPLVIFGFYSMAYSIGPYRILINYIQTITNTCNVFKARVAYNFITWATAFVCTYLLPTLIDFIGIGWVFWYMGTAGIFALIFVIMFLPDLQQSVIELNILENVELATDYASD